MLDLRPNCECCDVDLPPDAEARICSYECTFCVLCADGQLGGVCPNCGGNLVPRPIRPSAALATHPPSNRRVFNPECRSDAGGILVVHRACSSSAAPWPHWSAPDGVRVGHLRLGDAARPRLVAPTHGAGCEHAHHHRLGERRARRRLLETLLDHAAAGPSERASDG